MVCHEVIKNQKEIAIIMGTYNGEQYIAEQIESILDNTSDSFVLYIFDDGSTDKTLEIAKQYAEKYPDIVKVHKNSTNLRTIANFIRGTQSIESEYYMFCDQDDYWKQDKISKSLDFVRKTEGSNHDKPTVIFTDAEVVDERLNILQPSFQKFEHLNSYNLSLEGLLMENKLMGCTVMFNRATRDILASMEDIPMEVRMHDWWIGLIGAAFGKVAYLNEPLLKYRQHSDNEVGSLGAVGYVLSNITHLKEQRILLYALFQQGEAFLKEYRNSLSAEQIEYLQEFSTFYRGNFVVRKYKFVKNNYRKTGVIRNIGMFVII